MTRPLYNRFAWAYDELVPDPAGLSVERIAERLEPGCVVVDAGCGTGRYTAGLARLGFRVIGIDRSAALLAQARARTDAELIEADLLDWEPREPVDAVFCRGVLNDLTADADRRAAFAAFARWLRPGGVLIADVRDWDATVERYAGRGPVEQSAGDLRYRTETTLDGGLMRIHETYGDERHEFTMRPWTPAEVRTAATAAGFASVDVQPGGDVGIAPDRLLVVARVG